MNFRHIDRILTTFGNAYFVGNKIYLPTLALSRTRGHVSGSVISWDTMARCPRVKHSGVPCS